MNANLIPSRLSRRTVIAGAGAWLMAAHLPAWSTTVFAEVWKDPSCGCCKDWIAYLQANGFKVKVHDTGNIAARTRLGVDAKYGSCHTALIGGYAVEGHVPVREIHRLLKERPAAIGLSVPGMPVGAPGMDGPAYGGRKDAYGVMLLTKGGAKVYQQYPGNKA